MFNLNNRISIWRQLELNIWISSEIKHILKNIENNFPMFQKLNIKWQKIRYLLDLGNYFNPNLENITYYDWKFLKQYTHTRLSSRLKHTIHHKLSEQPTILDYKLSQTLVTNPCHLNQEHWIFSFSRLQSGNIRFWHTPNPFNMVDLNHQIISFYWI